MITEFRTAIVSEWLKATLILVGSAVFCALLIHPVLGAQWSIIDDHWAMHYISKIQRLQLSPLDIVPLTLDSEVGDFGRSARYRPSYHFLYVAEAFLWGDTPSLWWGTRFCIFVSLFASLWWFAARQIPLLPAGVFTAWLFVPGYWVDVWGRLGPGELYASLGVALFVLGATQWFEALRREDREAVSLWWPCFLVTAGVVIAVGSKENFVVLIIPVFLLSAWSWFRRRCVAVVSGCFLVCGAYTALITASIGLYLMKNQRDVYNRDVTAQGVTSLLWTELVNISPLVLWVVALTLCVGVTCWLFRRAKQREVLDATCVFVGSLVLLLLLHVSQFVFYSGNYPTNMRYDFPGAFAIPFAWLAGWIFLSRCAVIVGMPRYVSRAGVVIVALVLSSVIYRDGYASIRGHSVAIRQQSRSFTHRVTKTANRCRKQPSLPIMFDSYDIWDFERIGSVRRFLLAKGVRNQMVLRINYSALQFPEGSLERSLARQLEAASRGEVAQRHGQKEWSADYTTFGFSSLDGVQLDGPVLVIDFSGKSSLPRGVRVGAFGN